MAQERDIALGVMQVAVVNGGLCTFKRAYAEIPNYVKLSAANLRPSGKRPGELMWEQIVRNIKSHDTTSFIADGLLVHVRRTGYRITKRGVDYLKARNLHP